MTGRTKDTRAAFGKMTVKPNGAFSDKEKFDALPVNRAEDMDLAEALADRGYDVTCVWVSPETLERRAAALAKKKSKAKGGAE